MARKVNETIVVTENVEEIETTTKIVTEKYKTEKCRVLSYNSKTKELDVDFKGYGIRLNNVLKNVKNVDSNYVDIKYIGEIGSPDFSCKL